MNEPPVLKCTLCLWTAITSPAERVGFSPAGYEYLLCERHAKDTKIRVNKLRHMGEIEIAYRVQHPPIKSMRRTK